MKISFHAFFTNVGNGLLVVFILYFLKRWWDSIRSRFEISKSETEALLEEYTGESDPMTGIQSNQDYRHKLSKNIGTLRFLVRSFRIESLITWGFIVMLTGIFFFKMTPASKDSQIINATHLSGCAFPVFLPGIFVIVVFYEYALHKTNALLSRLQNHLKVCTDDIPKRNPSQN